MEDSLLKRASYKYVLIRSLTVKPRQNQEGYFDLKMSSEVSTLLYLMFRKISNLKSSEKLNLRNHEDFAWDICNSARKRPTRFYNAFKGYHKLQPKRKNVTVNDPELV